jgi:hypothetical protein
MFPEGASTRFEGAKGRYDMYILQGKPFAIFPIVIFAKMSSTQWQKERRQDEGEEKEELLLAVSSAYIYKTLKFVPNPDKFEDKNDCPHTRQFGEQSYKVMLGLIC